MSEVKWSSIYIGKANRADISTNPKSSEFREVHGGMKRIKLNMVELTIVPLNRGFLFISKGVGGGVGGYGLEEM